MGQTSKPAAPRSAGRPPGKYLYADAFEAICAAMRVLKKDVCIDAQISPGFLTDLLAGRGCAGPDVVDRLSSSLGVRPAAIFPELAAKPWTSPLPDRAARRERAA